MWGLSSVIEGFNSRAREAHLAELARAHRNQLENLLAYIRRKDKEAIGIILDRAGYHGSSYPNALLVAALESDDPEVFDLLLNKMERGDTNCQIYRASSVKGDAGDVIHAYCMSPLNMALEQRKKNVALHIAKNPVTDVTFTGYFEECVYNERDGRLERTKTPYDPPLEMAEKHGFTEVAAVIAGRLAGLKREEAARLELTTLSSVRALSEEAARLEARALRPG